MKNKFEIVARKVVYDGFFKMLKFRVKHALYQGGMCEPYTREVLERGHAVAVLLHDKNRDEIVLIEQFRIGAINDDKPWMVELVAGIVEAGEVPEEVARREAMEECGAEVGELSLISEYYNSAGGSTETTTLFYAEIDATDVEGIHGLDHENEDIKVIKVSSDEFIQQLDANQFRSGSLVMAGYWFKTHVNRLR